MLHFITSSVGIGARQPGCKDGPLLIKKRCQALFPALTWDSPILLKDEGVPKSDVPSLVEAHTKLAQQTFQAVRSHNRFIVLAGDHSSAIGTWSGVSSALEGDLGLIWIDAHMDAHTPETTPSGNVHGMPVAVLMGYGDSRLTSIGKREPKLKPENLVEMGQRSFEEGESSLLRRLDVHIDYMTDVADKGFETVFKNALDYLVPRTQKIGISLDLDSLDPQEAPGVGSPTPNGILFSELIKGFSILQNYPTLCGIEIVEFNPHLDQHKLTEDKVVNLISFFQEVLS